MNLPASPTDPIADSSESVKAKRQRTIETWLAQFEEEKKSGLPAPIHYTTLVANTAKLLNDWYWMRLENDVLPYLEAENGNGTIANRYKIAACTELCVMELLPIQAPDTALRLSLNAELAHYMALNILFSWDLDDASSTPSPGDPTSVKDAVFFQKSYHDQLPTLFERTEIQEFIREHITFLVKWEPQFGFPIFISADILKLFHWYCLTLLSFQDVILNTKSLIDTNQYPTKLPRLFIKSLF